MFASMHLVNDPMNPCLRISYYRCSEYGEPFVPKISIVSAKISIADDKIAEWFPAYRVFSQPPKCFIGRNIGQDGGRAYAFRP